MPIVVMTPPRNPVIRPIISSIELILILPASVWGKQSLRDSLFKPMNKYRSIGSFKVISMFGNFCLICANRLLVIGRQ